MESIGRFLIIAGVILSLMGAGIYLLARLGLPLGHLPGDLQLDAQGGSFYLPIATSIIVSLILTFVLNILIHIFHR